MLPRLDLLIRETLIK